MSNANWQNHLNHTHQIYGSNGAGNLPINHGSCLTNCGSAACGAPLGMSGLGQQISWSGTAIATSLPNPLTPEEEKELKLLEEARQAETKHLKIKEFKKTSSCA